MAHFVEHVIEVISKPPEQRKEQEVIEILPWLRKRSNTLYQQTKAVLKNLIRNCHYRKSPRDDVIIQQGELGDCMYIILRGRISVYIDPSMTGEDEGFSPSPSPTKSRRGPGEESPTERRKAGERPSYGKFIIRFESGKSFGEIALMSEDSIRNASIITDTDCDFMVVDRDLFNTSLKEYEERSYAECRLFVHTHPFFSRMSQRFKRLLTLSLRKEKYGFESTLVKQGEPIIGLHFIRNGQAKIYMEPTRHRHQYPNLWPFEAAVDIYSIEFDWLREQRKNAILRKYRDPNKIPTKVDTVDIRRREGYAAVERKMHDKSVCLCGVQDGEVLGDTEITLGLGTYMQTVVCTSETDVFILDMKNYDRLICRKNPNTIQMMKRHVESKLCMRKDLKYAQQIPLLKFLHYKLTEEAPPEAKKLPPLKRSKGTPGIDQERQYILENFREGRAPLMDPQVPGGVYYKNLMHERARIRENIRNRISHFAPPINKKKIIRNPNRRQPRSRREIVESLKQMIEADILMVREPKKKKAPANGSVRDTDTMSLMTASRRTSFSNATQSRRTSFSRKNKSLYGSSGSLNTDTDEKDSVMSEEWLPKKKMNFVPKPPSEPNSGKSTPRRRHSFRGAGDDQKQELVLPELVNDSSAKVSHGITPPVSGRGPQLSESTTMLPPIREDTAERLLSLERKESTVSKEPNLEHAAVKEVVEVTEDNGVKDSSDVMDTTEVNEVKNVKDVDKVKDVKEVKDMKDAQEDVKDVTEPEITDVTQVPALPLQSEIPKLESQEGFHLPYQPKSTARSTTSSTKSRWDPAKKIVQERIHQRVSTQLEDKDPSFADYDTSDNTLSYLESRIRSFHIKYGNKNKMSLKLPKLRRYNGIQQVNPENQPRPGGKVWIRQQLCQFADKRVEVKGHKHVRYHMVDSLPMFEEVKKTRMIMNYLLSAKNQTDAKSHGGAHQAITFTPDG